MSAAHTPGPWYVSKEFDGTSIKAGMFHVTHTIKACGFHEPEVDKAVTQANARLIAAAPDLLEACQTFAGWLRREDDGFDHKTHNRQTPEGEAAWREWFYGNIALCGLAQEQVRAAIAKATGGAV